MVRIKEKTHWIAHWVELTLYYSAFVETVKITQASFLTCRLFAIIKNTAIVNMFRAWVSTCMYSVEGVNQEKNTLY